MDIWKILENTVPALIVFAFGWGVLNQKVKDVCERIKEIDSLKSEVSRINETLNQLVGKIDTWFYVYKKGE